MHIRHSSTNHKLIESSFVSCVAYTILIWSHSEHIFANFLSDYMRCEVAQIPAPFTPTQCISVFTRKCYICRSVYMRFEIAQIQSTFKTNILISLCDNCQEAISLESTQAMSPYHPRKVHHRSLFQRKQAYWTHWMVPLRTTAICCSWQPTITTHSTKLW